MVLFGYQVFDPLKSGCPVRWKMPPVTLDELKVVEAETLPSFLALVFSVAASYVRQGEGSLANITQTINHAMLCLLVGRSSASLAKEV